MAVLVMMLVGPIERFVRRLWPPDMREDLGAPRYAVAEAVADVPTATDLLEKEQVRMIAGTREYLASVRATGGAPLNGTAAALNRTFGRLFHAIEHFNVALVSKQFDEWTSARLGNVQARQKVVELLEDSLHQLSVCLEVPWRDRHLELLVENVVETLDFLLMFACEAAATLDEERANLLFSLSSDRSEMMAAVRNLYLAPDGQLNARERALMLRLTALFERIVWMVQRYAELLQRNMDPNPLADRSGLGVMDPSPESFESA
jgi:phosphate:Na+ symporter